ncbi:MAG: tetratricopeptide repeat protein [Acidobacteriota bacterium]
MEVDVIRVMCMGRLFSGFLCAVLVFSLPLEDMAQTGTGREQQIQDLEQQVQKALQQQEPQLAIPLLRKIVALDPKNLDANANLGVLLFFQNQYADALPPLRTALQLQPDLWRILALAGIAEKRTGNPLAGQADLEQAFPHLNDAKIRKQAGLELVELDSSFGQLAKAAAVTEILEELLPQDPQILFAAWEISSQMSDQTLLNMLMVAPNSGEMHMIIGGQLGRQGDHAGAIAQYRRAIQQNPKLPGVHFELAEQLRASADPALNAQAEAEYRSAVQENPYDVKSWCRLGDSAAGRSDFKAAEDDYKKALALQPKDSDALTGLGIALITQNRNAEALPLLEAAVREDPTDTVAHYRLSVLYRRAGRLADAQHEMNEFNHYRDLKAKLGQIFQQVRAEPDQRVTRGKPE